MVIQTVFFLFLFSTGTEHNEHIFFSVLLSHVMHIFYLTLDLT